MAKLRDSESTYSSSGSKWSHIVSVRPSERKQSDVYANFSFFCSPWLVFLLRVTSANSITRLVCRISLWQHRNFATDVSSAPSTTTTTTIRFASVDQKRNFGAQKLIFVAIIIIAPAKLTTIIILATQTPTTTIDISISYIRLCDAVAVISARNWMMCVQREERERAADFYSVLCAKVCAFRRASERASVRLLRDRSERTLIVCA